MTNPLAALIQGLMQQAAPAPRPPVMRPAIPLPVGPGSMSRLPVDPRFQSIMTPVAMSTMARAQAGEDPRTMGSGPSTPPSRTTPPLPDPSPQPGRVTRIADLVSPDRPSPRGRGR